VQQSFHSIRLVPLEGSRNIGLGRYYLAFFGAATKFSVCQREWSFCFGASLPWGRIRHRGTEKNHSSVHNMQAYALGELAEAGVGVEGVERGVNGDSGKPAVSPCVRLFRYSPLRSSDGPSETRRPTQVPWVLFDRLVVFAAIAQDCSGTRHRLSQRCAINFFVEVLHNKLTGGLTDPRAVTCYGGWLASNQVRPEIDPELPS
jgi:hypothetical protein